MADSQTPLTLLIDQATGENPTTWGTKADTNFALIEQMAKNAYAYTVPGATGDMTLSDDAYLANENRRALIRLTGVRSAIGNVVFPTRALVWDVLNETAYALTCKTTAGTGISIPAGQYRRIYCDGTDILDSELINQDQLTAALSASSAAGFSTTSTTSNPISVAGTNLTFTTADSGKAFSPGSPVVIAYTPDPANFQMSAIVTSYSSTTLMVTVSDAVGAGTLADWSISVAGGPDVTAATIVRSAKTTSYAMDLTDNGKLIDCTSGSFTVTLPAAAVAGNGFNVRVINTGAGTITLDGDGSETINGAANKSLAQYQSVHVICNGTSWAILSPSKIVSAELGSGTADATTFLRGDMTWAATSSTIENISANDTLVGADTSTCKRVTANVTIALTAAATLGAGWWCDVIVDGDYDDLRVVTFDPNSSEEIDEQTSIKAYLGEQFRIYCDGTKFRTYGRKDCVFFGEVAVGTSTTYDFFTDGAFLDDPEIQAFRIVVDGVSHDNGSARALLLRFCNGSGTVNTGSDYNYGNVNAWSTITGTGSGSATAVTLTDTGNSSLTLNADIEMARLPLAGQATGRFVAFHSNGTPWLGAIHYLAEIGGFRLLLSGAGNFDAGVARVWGTRARRA